MVDVTPKEASHRRAIARCRVHMAAETASLVARGAIAKGDVIAVARVAGIQAAKRTRISSRSATRCWSVPSM